MAHGQSDAGLDPISAGGLGLVVVGAWYPYQESPRLIAPDEGTGLPRYALTAAPVANSLILWDGGVHLLPGATPYDYTLSGNTITFNAALPADAQLWAYYLRVA